MIERTAAYPRCNPCLFSCVNPPALLPNKLHQQTTKSLSTSAGARNPNCSRKLPESLRKVAVAICLDFHIFSLLGVIFFKINFVIIMIYKKKF